MKQADQVGPRFALTAEEAAAQVVVGRPLPGEMSPLTLREVVWASAYAADFARQFSEIRSAVDPGPFRDESSANMVDAKRCKAVADAAVEGLEK